MAVESLMSIGQFSGRSRISVRMLRHYDAHGVLVPADVDPVTAHRRYAPGQLADAAEIRRLRGVGIGVAAMAALLSVRGTPAYQQGLEAQRHTVLAELDQAQQRLDLLDRLIAEPEGMPMSITVTRTTIPERTLVTLRGVIPSYFEEGLLWARFIPMLQEQGLQPIGPGGCIEHDEEFKESDVDESVWLPVPAGTIAEAPLEIAVLPEQEVVLARVIGSYAQISEAHEQIAAFLDEHRLVAAQVGSDDLATKVFNRYLTDPSTTAEADLVTEVCLPLRSAAS